jgi:hypothetical protein
MKKWLEISKISPEISNEFTYIGIMKFPTDYLEQVDNFKDISIKEKNKIKKQRKNEIKKQKNCIEFLKENDIIDLINTKCQLESILKSSSWTSVFDNFDNYYIIKIQSLNTEEIYESYTYPNPIYTRKFKIVKRFKTLKQFLTSLADDMLLKQYSEQYFYNHFAGNKEYKEQVVNYFTYMNKNFLEQMEWLSFFQLFFVDTYNNIYSDFKKNDFCKGRREIVNEIFNKKLINMQTAYHWQFSEAFITQCITLDLIDIVKEYFNNLSDTHKGMTKESQKIKECLKNNIQNENTYCLYSLFKLEKEKVITLEVYDKWQNNKLIDRINFEDLDSTKEHLMRQYDFSFKEVNSKQINELEYEPCNESCDDSCYIFKIK